MDQVNCIFCENQEVDWIQMQHFRPLSGKYAVTIFDEAVLFFQEV